MDNLTWLLAANAAMWAGLGAFIIRLAITQHNITKRLKHMELSRNG